MYQIIPKTRFSKNKFLVILVYGLLAFILLIISFFFANILKKSNTLAYETRRKDYERNSVFSQVGCDGCSDILSYTKFISFNNKITNKLGSIFSQVARQGGEKVLSFFGFFSSEELFVAMHFNKTKGLINSSKVFFKYLIVLCKYRLFNFKNQLEVFQAKIYSFTNLYQNKDSLSLVKGLVLGEKEQNNSYYDSFSRAGMLHVLVASGFNISLLVIFFGKTSIFLSRKIHKTFLLVVIWSYTWFLGGDPPLLRASLMMTFSLLIISQGIKIHSRRIIVFSAIILLSLYPEFFKSLSFWFSFLATAGISFFYNRTMLFTSRETNFLGFFKSEMSSSFAAQSLLLPLIMVTFNELNWLSFIANSFLLFPIAWFTQLGFIFLILIGLFKSIFSGFLSFILVPFLLIYDSILSVFLLVISKVSLLFFLQQPILSQERTWFLLMWGVCISSIIFIFRTKHNRKVVFFHENH